MATAIAKRGQQRLADKTTQSFTQIVDTIRSVRWYLPGVTVEDAARQLATRRSSGRSTSREPRRFQDEGFDEPCDIDCKEHRQRTLHPANCGLDESPDALWQESDMMEAVQTFPATDSAEAERASKEEALRFLGETLCAAVEAYLNNSDSSSEVPSECPQDQLIEICSPCCPSLHCWPRSPAPMRRR